MKNLLKSIFISLFPLTSLIYLIHGIINSQTYSLFSLYLGRNILSSGIVFFFVMLFIKPVPRTSAIPKTYTLWIFAGFAISMIYKGLYLQDILASLPSLFLFIGWVLYLNWFSVFKNRKKNVVLKVGLQLPEFKLENTKRDYISSTQFSGSSSIFLFFRGNWCPLCMAQIKEVAAQYKSLEERGVNMVFISPQPHKYSRSLASKYNLGFHFLVDKGNKVATQLGILSKNGIPAGFQTLGYDSDTVLPTVIITNSEGKIIYVNLTNNYRVRPEPSTFIEILDQQTVTA